MGFRQKAYAKIWTLDEKEKYSDAYITIGRKNKESGEYEVSFAYKYVRLVGKANTKAQKFNLPTLKEYYDKKFNRKKNLSVNIQITNCNVDYKFEENKTPHFVIFDFELTGFWLS